MCTCGTQRNMYVVCICMYLCYMKHTYTEQAGDQQQAHQDHRWHKAGGTQRFRPDINITGDNAPERFEEILDLLYSQSHELHLYGPTKI